MRKPLIKFGIFCNHVIGRVKLATDINDLLCNKMTRHQLQNWTEIKFKDEEGRTIQITEEFIQQGMTIDEIIEDWIQDGITDDQIHVLHRNKVILL